MKSKKTNKRPPPAKRGTRKDALSLYPLSLEQALGAALKTGGPPPEPKKARRTTSKKR